MAPHAARTEAPSLVEESELAPHRAPLLCDLGDALAEPVFRLETSRVMVGRLGNIDDNYVGEEISWLVIPKGAVNRRHATIRLTSAGFVLEDRQSECGIFVNGTRLKCPVLLSHGHVASFDVWSFAFEYSSSAPAVTG